MYTKSLLVIVRIVSLLLVSMWLSQSVHASPQGYLKRFRYDTRPPTVPTNLTASAVSSSQINLSWSASTDNVGVTGYRVYRSGTQISTATRTSYAMTGL